MYYRYRPRKKDRRFLKTSIIFIVALSLIYAGYTNRHKLMFWKMNQNRMVHDIKKAQNVPDREKRIKALNVIMENLAVYKAENNLDPEAFIMSGNVNYLLGEAECRCSFSELYISNSFTSIPGKSKKYFLSAVKDLLKAGSLLDGKGCGVESVMVLVKSMFYTDYYSLQEISGIIGESVRNENITMSEDVRFASVVSILSGNADQGLEFMKKSGKVDDTVQGRILYARALSDSRKYTEAIVAFKKITDSSRDSAVIRLAYLNLGKIYFNQHLYKESLEQFEGILKMDESDTDSKIWLGRNYSAMGYGDKARAIWAEVLASNRENEEVQKLLGLM